MQESFLDCTGIDLGALCKMIFRWLYRDYEVIRALMISEQIFPGISQCTGAYMNAHVSLGFRVLGLGSAWGRVSANLLSAGDIVKCPVKSFRRFGPIATPLL